jgi:hypothetical protein
MKGFSSSPEGIHAALQRARAARGRDVRVDALAHGRCLWIRLESLARMRGALIGSSRQRQACVCGPVTGL